MKTEITNRGVTTLKAKLNLQIDTNKKKPVNEVEQKLYHYKAESCFVLHTTAYYTNGYFRRSSFSLGSMSKPSYHQIPCARYSDKKLLEVLEETKDLQQQSLLNELWNTLKVYPHQVSPVKYILEEPITEIIIHRLSQPIWLPISETTANINQIENPRGSEYNLQELYHHLNCTTIEVVTLENGNILIIDE
jgi:hypothetical protein